MDAPKAREEILRRMAAYHLKAEQEFVRRRDRLERRHTLAVRTSA